MQLRLDAADRLVELVEDRRGPVPADEAARKVLKLGNAVPTGLARTLLGRGCRGRRPPALGRRPRGARCTGRRPSAASSTRPIVVARPRDDRAAAGHCLGQVRSAPCACEGSSSRSDSRRSRTPARRSKLAIAALTGLRDADLRRAPPVAAGIRRFLEFSGDAVLVAHNARFDMAFLDNETMRLTGNRVAATVVDTVGLARRLLGRQPANLGALAHRFVTEARPCHRALPDAEATAEILLRLIGMAQERGARTVADLVELGATRPRRSYGKRSLRSVPQTAGRPICSVMRTTRCCTSARRAICARGPLVLSIRAAAPRDRGGARCSRADRVARRRFGSLKRGSRSCA